MAMYRKNNRPRKLIQSDGGKRTLECCVSRVVAHYPVGIWLRASVGVMGRSRAPTPQRCNLNKVITNLFNQANSLNIKPCYFKRLLNFVTKNCYYLQNNTIYKQITAVPQEGHLLVF